MDDLPPAFVAALEAAAEMAMAPGDQRLLVIAPRRLEEAQRIIEAVRANQTVVLQTAQADDGVAQRLIDFACGGMVALDGQVHRIDAGTFLFAPALVRVEQL
jgi:FtsZ-interacting cell division protein YlmF